MNDEQKAWELAGLEAWAGYDPRTNQIRSISGEATQCIHGPKCPLCFLASRGPVVDVDLGPDL